MSGQILGTKMEKFDETGKSSRIHHLGTRKKDSGTEPEAT
jgi:hypothetical protein